MKRLHATALILGLAGVAVHGAEKIVPLAGGQTMKFTLCHAKKLATGPPEAAKDVPPEVTIRVPFYLSAAEVTRGQFAAFAGDSGYTTQTKPPNWRSPGFAQTDDDPVAGTTKEDREAFCRWLTARITGRASPRGIDERCARRADTLLKQLKQDQGQFTKTLQVYMRKAGGDRAAAVSLLKADLKKRALAELRSAPLNRALEYRFDGIKVAGKPTRGRGEVAAIAKPRTLRLKTDAAILSKLTRADPVQINGVEGCVARLTADRLDVTFPVEGMIQPAVRKLKVGDTVEIVVDPMIRIECTVAAAGTAPEGTLRCFWTVTNMTTGASCSGRRHPRVGRLTTFTASSRVVDGHGRTIVRYINLSPTIVTIRGEDIAVRFAEPIDRQVSSARLAGVADLAHAKSPKPGRDPRPKGAVDKGPFRVVLDVKIDEGELIRQAMGQLKSKLSEKQVVDLVLKQSEKLGAAGRDGEAMQLTEALCRVIPRSPRAWEHRSWEMAWLHSAMAATPTQRWAWVYGSVRLLRDEGIGQNPKAISLYKQLGWIYFSKIGGSTDEMHMSYKRRWAGKMQRLLGAPPLATTEETIDAFRPVADAADGPEKKDGTRDQTQAFLDRTARPTGESGDPLQQRTFKRFLAHGANAQAAEYVAKLAELLTTDEDRKAGRRLDQIIGYRTLSAYNRFTSDEAVMVTRREPPRPPREREEALAKLIDAKRYAEARRRLLALIRAHVLWNHYRMDPAWMLAMMKHFGPLDWRQTFAHAMYWLTYGSHICHGTPLGQIDKRQAERIKTDALNTDRLVMHAMKSLTWYGRMVYLEDPQDPSYPEIGMSADWRFIKHTNDAYDRLIRAVSGAKGENYKANTFKEGHVNFLAGAVNALYAAYRHREARELFEWTKKTYDLHKAKHWGRPLDDFVAVWLNEGGAPIPEVALSQMTGSLQAGFAFLAAGNRKAYNDSLRYAQRVHKKFNAAAPAKRKLRPFHAIVDRVFMLMLVQPRLAGYNLSLDARGRVWAIMPHMAKRRIYQLIARPLARECDAWHADFHKTFPAPPGLQE